jgi:hypothetical protein
LNILKRGVSYSPMGGMKGVIDATSGVKKGTKTTTEAIDQMAADLSGTGIMLLGTWLASNGIISGTDDEPEREKAFEELQGDQNYTLNLGEVSFVIDWTAPVDLPLFIGVELYNSFKKDNPLFNFARLVDGMTKIFEPLVNLSLLQGINNTIHTSKYSDTPFAGITLHAVTDYIGQGIPTLVGQVTRTVDDNLAT